MKKALLLIVVVLLAATFLGRWMAADSGYLLVIRDQWRLESTLGFALLALILGAVALVVLTLLGNLAWNLAEPVRATRRFRRGVARRRLKSGFILLMDGELDKAERLLTAAGRDGDWPLVRLVAGGGNAPASGGDGEALEEYLQNAAKSRRGDSFSGLMRARFALDDGRPAAAHRELKGLVEKAPGNKRILGAIRRRAGTRARLAGAVRPGAASAPRPR